MPVAVYIAQRQHSFCCAQAPADLHDEQVRAAIAAADAALQRVYAQPPSVVLAADRSADDAFRCAPGFAVSAQDCVRLEPDSVLCRDLFAARCEVATKPLFCRLSNTANYTSPVHASTRSQSRSRRAGGMRRNIW